MSFEQTLGNGAEPGAWPDDIGPQSPFTNPTFRVAQEDDCEHNEERQRSACDQSLVSRVVELRFSLCRR
jgi:hypothetical protein